MSERTGLASGEISMRRGDSPVQILGRHVRYSLRRLARSPGFTATAVLSLALGIGANVTLFSLVDAVLLKAPPLEEADRLALVYTFYPSNAYGLFAYPDFEDLREGTSDAFSGLAASVPTIGQVDREGRVEALLGEVVSGNYFSLQGLGVALGRTFTPEDDIRPGGHPVVLISHGYWQRAFGGAPDVVGRDLRVNGRPYTVIGVAHEDYHGSLRGFRPDFYAPAMMYDEIEMDTRTILKTRDSHRFFVRGRLRPGVSLAQAQVAVDRVAAQFREDFGWGAESGFLVVPLQDVIVHPPLDRFLRAAAWLLSGVVGLVLLVVCTNLAGFFLARNIDRHRETAVRLALGASRGSLVGQVLAETTVLSLVGGLAGVAVAGGLLHALSVADLPLPVPVTLDLGLDASVLAFSLVLSVVAGLALGLLPAVQNAHLDVASGLKDASAGAGTSRRRLSLRHGLVTAQVAVCVVLLVCAGLFLRSLDVARSVDPGFGRHPAALLTVAVSPQRYTEDQGRVLMQQLLDRVQQIPGVRGVGITNNMLLRKTGRETMQVQVAGVEPPPGRTSFMVDKASVDPGFFDAMGIPILEGRSFDSGDHTETRGVAIVSAAMAERFWPDEEAVGRRITCDGAEELTVVGVARDAKVLDLGEAPRPFVYLPFGQSYSALTQVVARTDREPERVALEMIAAARGLDPELVLWAPTSMERHLSLVLLPARLSAWILSTFAALALLLASLGLYGIVSYSVSQRTREAGIRMSLGASTRAVILMFLVSGMRLVVVGCALGLGVSVLLSRALRSLLFGIEPLDPVTFGVAPLVLLAVAALAAWVAARRVSSIDPARALRTE